MSSCDSNSGFAKNLSFQEHGFQFVLKFLKLKRILPDFLWVRRDECFSFLKDMLNHFEVINYVNMGVNYKEKFGESEFAKGIKDDGLGLYRKVDSVINLKAEDSSIFRFFPMSSLFPV